MDEILYRERLEKLFVRFPSVQNVGFGSAYKPGLEHMQDFAARMGHPENSFKTIHVAGTNGKGSVANMMAAALASTGMRVGLYTSPHIIDFRERMRIVDGRLGTPAELISKENVWQFLNERETDFDDLSLSFFEITTGMAFWWFAEQKVDVAVIEVGLGGRLDSTNIITPGLSIVASIGLDHCAMLGNTRAEIAAEKAGIFKPGIPAVVGIRDDETAPVFQRIAARVGAELTFADSEEMDLSLILPKMDLQGSYQELNLRTVLVSLKLLGISIDAKVVEAITHTAKIMDFHGRWEMIAHDPDMICDIGHNPPALMHNFGQLRQYLSSGKYSHLIIVYGVMADKDLDGILPLMPEEATYICVAPATPRAMKVDVLYDKCRSFWASEGRETSRIMKAESVWKGIELAKKISKNQQNTLIYIGGSTFVVSEAVSNFNIL